MGRTDHSVVLYGLSTCVWCRKMKQYLESESVVFDVVYVDLLRGEEREAALSTVKRWNPATSFPTVVIDDQAAVRGYRPDEVRGILGCEQREKRARGAHRRPLRGARPRRGVVRIPPEPGPRVHAGAPKACS